MKRAVAKIVKGIVPAKVLAALFPQKFGGGPFKRKFVTIKDKFAGKPIKMYLREDSMMERMFLADGLYGDWEKESLKIWAALSREANTIIDIGANTGVFALLAQNNNPSAKVIAIEPVEVNFDVLSKNIAENHFPIYAENIALSDKEGTARMYMLKDRLNYMTSVNDNRYALHPEVQGSHEVVEIEVPIRPFSYVFVKGGLKEIDLVKIDVEGHEPTVLQSMLPYIEKSKPVILIEIIGDENAVQLQEMFIKLGYQFVSINEKDRSKVVERLWDNDHHNFLLCHGPTIEYLRKLDLVV